jgi:hypothetical protein
MKSTPGTMSALPFLSPLGNLHVDLLANLRADLAGVTREEREETL